MCPKPNHIPKNKMKLIFLFLACGAKENDSSLDDTAADTSDTATENQNTEPTVEPSVEPVDPNVNDLSNISGCSDYFVYAYNDADTQTLHISGSGLAQEAHSNNTSISRSYTINPDTDDIQPTLVMQIGENLNHASCNDAIIPGMEPVVADEWRAISGTVSFSVTPAGEATDWGEYPAEMDITLEEIVLSNDTSSVEIPTMSLSAAIGWMPG